MGDKAGKFLASAFALLFSVAAQAQQGNYTDVSADLVQGIGLQDTANRAHENADAYWENKPGHGTGQRDGSDEDLSAGEAVTEIYTNATLNRDKVNPQALDIVEVTLAVIDAWPDCEDTFDAVRAAVALQPGRAAEIVANVATKRDCNCSNGGLWVDQRLHDRIRVDMRHYMLDVPQQCSCSQVAMYAGIAGLPENSGFRPDMDEAKKAELVGRMTEKVTNITEWTSAIQNKIGWECGCTEVNIAATMQGIGQDELRDGTYAGLAEKYVEDAGDTGFVVDSFGVVGMHPMEYWGDRQYVSRENSLERKPEVYRGDNLVLDPFSPATEFVPHGDRQFEHLKKHVMTADNVPTDLIISEYIEGWNAASLAKLPAERDPMQRNRVIELYNGSKKTIDLGTDQYFLEIYGPGTATTSVPVENAMRNGEYYKGDSKPRQVIGLNGAIEAGQAYVVAFSDSDEVLTEAADLVTGQLDFKANDTLVVRRLGGEMTLSCRAQAYSYVTTHPALPPIILQSDESSRQRPSEIEVASPN